jgi:hypothetical protein
MKTSVSAYVNRIVKKLLLLGLFFVPYSEAHVRWFIDPSKIPDVSFQFDGLMALTIAGAIGFICFCVYLERLSQTSSNIAKALKPSFSSSNNIEWYVLLAFLNLLLALNLMMGEFLAPNLVLPPNLVIVGIVIQLAVLLLLPFSVALVGAALLIVAFLSLLLFPFAIAMDYFFELIGVGLAYIFIAPHICRFDRTQYKRFSIEMEQAKYMAATALRIGLGLQLFTLAVHNKLLEPGATLLFVQEFPFYNFMQGFGFDSYSHLHFVFAAGLFEATFGLLLCLGIAVRFVGLTLAAIFTTTALLSGISELLGHLPIFIVVVIIIIHGDPERDVQLNINSLVKG